MLHLAITYSKRTYMMEFGTLGHFKKFMTQLVFCTEHIDIATTSAYMIILPSLICYLNFPYNMQIYICHNLLNYCDTFLCAVQIRSQM